MISFPLQKKRFQLFKYAILEKPEDKKVTDNSSHPRKQCDFNRVQNVGEMIQNNRRRRNGKSRYEKEPGDKCANVSKVAELHNDIFYERRVGKIEKRD